MFTSFWGDPKEGLLDSTEDPTKEPMTQPPGAEEQRPGPGSSLPPSGHDNLAYSRGPPTPYPN